jgi:cobalt-zinc-cadmium resistance protein CzcA
MNARSADSESGNCHLDQRQSGRRESGWLEKLVRGAIEARVMVLFISIICTILGACSFAKMHIDAVPDVSNIQVTVTATARGLAPKEIEEYVTYPIELCLQSLPKLKQLRSVSKFSLCQVTAVFEDGADIYWARQQVSERLKLAQEQLPTNNEIRVALGPIATGLGEIYQFQVKGFKYNLMELRDILDWQVIPALKTAAGVDEIQSMGGEAREYQVLLDHERLHGFGISVSKVMAALSNNNANSGGGYIIENDDQTLIRVEGMLHNVADIGNVAVRRDATGVIKVKDLGRVVIGHKQHHSIVTENGHGETVIGVVVMRKGENSKEVLGRLERAVKTLGPTLAGVAIEPFYDRSILIEQTIETVWHNLAHGALFVMVVLFLLLGGIRGAIVAALAIPLSLLGAVSFLVLSNTSGNLLSLGAIDFGILIDGSVVMVENIIRRLAESEGDRLSVVMEAAAEVARPVFFAVLIITVVYLPILALPGVAGKTFQPMALTVIFGLITAMLIGLFLTPTLSFFILPRKPSETDSFMLKLIRPAHRRALIACARHPRKSFAVALLIFLSSLITIPYLGSEFVPVLKEGTIVLTINRPVSGSLDAAARETTLMEKEVLKFPDVDKVVSRTGHSEIAFDPMGPDETDMFIILRPPSQWTTAKTQQEIEDAIVSKLRNTIPGAIFSVSQPIEQRMNELIAGAKSDVAVRIFGPDLDKLRELGAAVGVVLSAVPGTADMKLEQNSGLPVVTAKLNSAALAAYGVSTHEALNTVAASQAGKVVGTIYQGKPRYDLTVKFQPERISNAEEIGSLPVGTLSGELVPLRQLGEIVREEDPAQITHLQTDRTYMVQVNVRHRDLGSYVDEAQSKVKKEVALPPGYRIAWGGQFENLQEARNRLFILVPLVLLLIFMLLYASFGSMKPGLLIFSNIPLALSGGLFAMYLRGMPMSITAGVGFIALFGVAVLNGVVLLSTIQQLERQEGLNPRQAALKGAQQRLRPVLMTALVASLGFVPMALATSVGAEVQRPLATVVIGGLITSTALTLLVIPALYALLRGQRIERPVSQRAD